MNKIQATAVPTASVNVKENAATESKDIIPIVIKTRKEEKETKPTDVSVKKEKTEIAATATPLTIDELTERAERLHLYRIKYEEIRDKRKQLQVFAISHDEKNAQLTVVDANGLKISTSSPNSIKKLISDWSAELDAHLLKVEIDMRMLLENNI